MAPHTVGFFRPPSPALCPSHTPCVCVQAAWHGFRYPTDDSCPPTSCFPLQTHVCFLYLSSATLPRHARTSTQTQKPKPTSALSSRPSTDPGGSGPRYTEVLYEMEKNGQTICRIYRVYLITYTTDFAHKGFCTMAASAAASGFALNVLGEGNNKMIKEFFALWLHLQLPGRFCKNGLQLTTGRRYKLRCLLLRRKQRNVFFSFI